MCYILEYHATENCTISQPIDPTRLAAPPIRLVLSEPHYERW